MHAELPLDAAILPGEHGVGVTVPIAHAEPGGQSEHCSAADREEALAKVPGEHGSGDDEPRRQYAPGVHASHDGLPATD